MNTLYTITEAARQAGVSACTMRLYDMRGIIQPQRDSANRRLFTQQDIETARKYRASTRRP